MEDFTMIIASPFDREELLNEIYYKNTYLAEVNQEKDFLEIVLYCGNLHSISLPLNEFQKVLEKAKYDLIGESYKEKLESKRTFITSINTSYLDECKMLKDGTTVEVLYNNDLLAKVEQVNQSYGITFYFHSRNIEMPIESLQYILDEVKAQLMIE